MKLLTHLTLAMSLQATSSLAQTQETLNLFMWEGTLSEETQKGWEDRTGISLRMDYFDNDDERNQLMLRSQNLPFDIVVLDNVSANIFGDSGTLAKVDDLPNYANSSAQWNQACGPYAIPYFWGVVGLVYRSEYFETPPTSWKDLLLPDENNIGHIGLLNDTIETLLPALILEGSSPYTGSIEELKKAYHATSWLSRSVLTFEYPISYVRSAQDPNKLRLAMAYSGDHYALNAYEQNDNWKFALPKEGSVIWLDCLAINAHSPKVEQAKAFLNYLLDASVAAENALLVRAATTNKAAQQHLPDAFRKDETIFPSIESLKNSSLDSYIDKQNISQRAKIIYSIIQNHEIKH